MLLLSRLVNGKFQRCKAIGRAFMPLVGCLGANIAGKITAFHCWEGANFGEQACRLEIVSREDAAHGSCGANVARQGASVEVGHHHNVTAC